MAPHSRAPRMQLTSPRAHRRRRCRRCAPFRPPGHPLCLFYRRLPTMALASAAPRYTSVFELAKNGGPNSAAFHRLFEVSLGYPRCKATPELAHKCVAAPQTPPALRLAPPACPSTPQRPCSIGSDERMPSQPGRRVRRGSATRRRRRRRLLLLQVWRGGGQCAGGAARQQQGDAAADLVQRGAQPQAAELCGGGGGGPRF